MRPNRDILETNVLKIKSLKHLLGDMHNEIVYDWYIKRAIVALVGYPANNPLRDLGINGLFRVGETKTKKEHLHMIRNTIVTYSISEKSDGFLTIDLLSVLLRKSQAHLSEERVELSEEFTSKFAGVSDDADIECLLRGKIVGYDCLDTITKATKVLSFILSTKMFNTFNEEAGIIAMNFILIRGGYFGLPIFHMSRIFVGKMLLLRSIKNNDEHFDIVLEYLNYLTSALSSIMQLNIVDDEDTVKIRR